MSLLQDIWVRYNLLREQNIPEPYVVVMSPSDFLILRRNCERWDINISDAGTFIWGMEIKTGTEGLYVISKRDYEGFQRPQYYHRDTYRYDNITNNLFGRLA